jgi:hypothetical protein
MLRYTPPNFETLQAITRQHTELKVINEYRKKNQTIRVLQLKLLRFLLNSFTSEDNAYEILLGAWIFLREAIYNEYTLRSPTNSHLFNISESVLGIDAKSNPGLLDRNNLDNRTKFFHLSSFFNYLEKHQQSIHSTVFASARDIAKQAKCKLDNEIKPITARLPNARSLRQEFSELPSRYEEKCAADSKVSQILSYVGLAGRSTKRLQAIKLIKILDERCKASTTNDCEEKLNDYHLRLGALLKIMQDIEHEYRLGVRSPANSQLYKELQRITNLQHTSELNFEVKGDHLLALEGVLQRDLAAEQLELWKKNSINKEALEKIKDEITLLRGDFIKSKQKIIINNPAFDKLINKFLDCISVTIIESGIIFAALELANFLITHKLNFNFLLTIATPQNALILMSTLWAFKQIQGGINASLTNAFMPLVSPVVRAPLKAVYRNSLFRPNTEAKLSADDFKLISALYNASDEIVPPSEKCRLESLFDLKKTQHIDEMPAEEQTAHWLTLPF